MSRPTLYVSILKSITIQAYTCKANKNPDYINVMLNPLIKPYNLRGGPRAEQSKVNTTSCGLHSFKSQVAKLWNEMPSYTKEATFLHNFKSLLSKWPGPERHCGSCVLCTLWPVDSLHLGPVTRKMFPFDDVIMDLAEKVPTVPAIWVQNLILRPVSIYKPS